MTNDRIDLTPVDPTHDASRFDDLVRSSMDRAAGELAARRARVDTLAQLAKWRRPMLAAAVVIAVIASTLMLLLRREVPVATTAGIAEAVGVPDQLADWLRSGEMPGAADLLFVFEEGS